MSQTAPERAPLECEDLDAALMDKSVAVRAAACRDLSRVGQPARLIQLIEMAGHDKSPAVRLGTSSAAADILSRYRLPATRADLPDADRDRLLTAMNRVDPSVNAGLFPMLACLDHERSFSRISVGLRDPRRGVRLGAAVGLLRYVSSIVKAGDQKLEDDVLDCLSDNRMLPDSIAELARICAAGGYTKALRALETLDLGGQLQELVDQAITQLRLASERPVGLWVTDGLDAGEINPDAVRIEVLLVTETTMHRRVLGGDWVSVDPRTILRRMWLRRAGAATPVSAVQADGQTWYQPLDTELEPALGIGEVELTPKTAIDGDLTPLLAPLGEEPPGLRLRGLVALAAGQPALARDAFEAVIAAKKPPADIRTLLALAIEAADGPEAATAAWAEAVKKARPKSAWYARRALERGTAS